MPENSLFKGMAGYSETCDLATTVLTCEGNIGDPHFCRKLNDLISKLNQLISNGRAPFNVTRVEPWNSVRITFNIPREAAQRLRQLAEQGDSSLRELGILSVQIEGDQVITLTLSGRYNAAAQESLFRTDSLNQKLENVRNPSCLQNPHISSPGTSKDSYKAGTDSLLKSETEFRSPNVVAPSSNAPIPFTSEASRLSSTSHPFPFASMTHAMSTKHGSTNHHGPSSSVRFPFSPSLARTHSTSTVTSISTNAQSTSVPIVQKTSSTSSLLNNLVSHSSSLFSSSSSSSNKGVSLSSPLLVNLLQSEGSHPNKMMPPPAPVANNPIKKKRRPRKLKEADSSGQCVSPSHVSTVSTQGYLSLNQKTSQVRAKHATGIPATSKKDICKLPSAAILSASSDKSKNLVNPFTGQVESSDEDDEDLNFSYNLNSPNDSSSTFTNPLAKSSSGNIASTLWEQSANHRLTDSSFLSREMAKQDANTGEKLKLRLKLDTKTVKESKETGTLKDKRGKIDLTANKLDPGGPPAKRSKLKDPLQEPRVPPLHISLRGPNAAVVVSPKKEEQKIRKTPNNILNQELEKQLSYVQKKSRSLRIGSSPSNKLTLSESTSGEGHSEDKINGILEDAHTEECTLFKDDTPPLTDVLDINATSSSTIEEIKQRTCSPSRMEAPCTAVENLADPNEVSQEPSLVFRGLIATPGGETPESTSSQDVEPECGAKHKDDGSSPSADLEEEDKHSLDYPCHQLETPPDSGGPDFSLDDHVAESSDEYHHTSFSNKLDTFGSEPQTLLSPSSPPSCPETHLSSCPPNPLFCEKLVPTSVSLDNEEEEILKTTESLLNKTAISSKFNNSSVLSLRNDKLHLINSVIKENHCLPYSEMRLKNFPLKVEKSNSIFFSLSSLLGDMKTYSCIETGNCLQLSEVPSLAKAAKHSLVKALSSVYKDSHSLPQTVLNYLTSTILAKNNLLPPSNISSKMNPLMLKNNLDALALETKGLFQQNKEDIISNKLHLFAKNKALTDKIDTISIKIKNNLDIVSPSVAVTNADEQAATIGSLNLDVTSKSPGLCVSRKGSSSRNVPKIQLIASAESSSIIKGSVDLSVDTHKQDGVALPIVVDPSGLCTQVNSLDKASKEGTKETAHTLALQSCANHKETFLNLVSPIGSSQALVNSKGITTLTAANLNSLFAHAKRIALNSTGMFSGNGTLRFILKGSTNSKPLPFKLVNLSSGVLEIISGQGSSSDTAPFRRLVMSKHKVVVKVPGIRHPSTSLAPPHTSDIVIVSAGAESPLLENSLELEVNKNVMYSSLLTRLPALLPPTTSDCDTKQTLGEDTHPSPAEHLPTFVTISPAAIEEENIKKDCISTLNLNSTENCDAFRPKHQDDANSLVSKKPSKRKCSENAARLIKACVTLDNESNIRPNKKEEVAHLNNNELIASARINNEDSSDFQDEDSDDDMTLSELVEASKAKLAVKGLVQTLLKEEPHLVINRRRKKRSGSNESKKNDDIKSGVKFKRENKKTSTYFTANDIKRACGISDKTMKSLHQEGFSPLCDIVDTSPSRNKKAKESDSWPLKEEMSEISTLAKRKLRGTGLLDCPEPLAAKRRRTSAKEIHR